jgi:hypothetical protein
MLERSPIYMYASSPTLMAIKEANESYRTVGTLTVRELPSLFPELLLTVVTSPIDRHDQERRNCQD